MIPSLPVTQNPFLQIQTELRQKYPNLSKTELIIKSMDFMKEQFLLTISSDDTSMKFVASSQDHEDPDQDENEFAVLAGESQAPEKDEPNFGDFWNSFTSMIADKINREKDKKRKR